MSEKSRAITCFAASVAGWFVYFTILIVSKFSVSTYDDFSIFVSMANVILATVAAGLIQIISGIIAFIMVVRKSQYATLYSVSLISSIGFLICSTLFFITGNWVLW